MRLEIECLAFRAGMTLHDVTERLQKLYGWPCCVHFLAAMLETGTVSRDEFRQITEAIGNELIEGEWEIEEE